MKKYIFIFLFFPLACSQNFLEDMSSANPDEDYYSDGMKALNDESYDDVISIVNNQISTAGQTTSKVRELLASAYAGKCGLNFLDYTNKLSQNTTGSALSNLMQPFVQVNIDPASCRLALSTMELIGPTEIRTNNQNVFTSIAGMVQMGTALREYADTTPVLGDGSADINLCTSLTNAQVDDIIIGFGFFSKNFAAVTSSVIGSYSNASLGDFVSMCSDAVGAAACQITNPADITPTMRDSFRDLVNTQEYGVGAYVTGGDPLTVLGSCP